MPIVDCSEKGKSGKKFGEKGKCYTGKDAEEKAKKQGSAIKRSQAMNEEEKEKIKQLIDEELEDFLSELTENPSIELEESKMNLKKLNFLIKEEIDEVKNLAKGGTSSKIKKYFTKKENILEHRSENLSKDKMKLSKTRIKQLIKEELEVLLTNEEVREFFDFDVQEALKEYYAYGGININKFQQAEYPENAPVSPAGHIPSLQTPTEIENEMAAVLKGLKETRETLNIPKESEFGRLLGRLYTLHRAILFEMDQNFFPKGV